MDYFELELEQKIDFKFIRLNKPKLNNTYLPISGEYFREYNYKSDNEDSDNNNKNYDEIFEIISNPSFTKLFSIPESSENFCSSMNSMLQISNTFGKVQYGELLEALIIVINNSTTDEIYIRDLRVLVTNEPFHNLSHLYKKTEFILYEESYAENYSRNSNNFDYGNKGHSNFNYSTSIPPKKYYSKKVSLSADIICKYNLTVDISYTCNYFNNEYQANLTGNKILKNSSNNYIVESPYNIVYKKYNKKMVFENNLPFKIKDKVISNILEKGYVEITLINQSIYTLRLNDYCLKIASSRTLNKSKSIDNQKEEFNKYLTNSIENNNINSSGFDNNENNIIKPMFNEDSDIVLEPEDEYNFLYCLDDYNSFINIETFSFELSWVHMFDSIPKHLNFIVKNNYKNDVYNLTLFEKPFNNSVCLNDIYLIKLSIENINKSKNNLI